MRCNVNANGSSNPQNSMSGAGPAPAARPPAPPASLSWRAAARAWRSNGLGVFPEQTFEEDVVRSRFFTREQIILSRPAGIKRVLVDNSENYRRTAATVRILGPIVGTGILLAEGEMWRQQRRVLAPAFAPRTIPILARTVAAVAENAVAEFASAGEDGIDLLAAMQYLSLEVAGRAMISLETAAFAGRVRELLEGYARRLARPTLFDLLLPPGFPTLHDFRRRRFRRRWRPLVSEIVEARSGLARGAEGSDIFDLLQAAWGEDGAKRPEILLDEVATLLVAGHETTALLLFWACQLLALEPEVAERLAEEASGLALDPESAAQTLPNLVYARAVVHEALRLYPPAFAIVRQARGADDAGGVAVPAGAVILIAPYVLHRHRRLWADPETFDPTRFLPGAPPPDRFAYLPFGIGPRSCLGTQLALTEATLVLARLAQAFRIELDGGEEATPVAAITLRPNRSPRFRLRARQN